MSFKRDGPCVARARALLEAHCTLEQRTNWAQRGWLWPVRGTQGGLFGFGSYKESYKEMGFASGELFYQVWEFTPKTERRFRYCVLPRDGYYELPEFDCILGVKLLIESDEDAFRKIANVAWDARQQVQVQNAQAAQAYAIQQQVAMQNAYLVQHAVNAQQAVGYWQYVAAAANGNNAVVNAVWAQHP